MIKEGILENPKVDAAIAAHVWPSIDSGKICIKYGAMMAAPDYFKITVFGKGGHGAMPNKCIDPIALANHIYSQLQTLISRTIDPLEPAIISVGKFQSGSAFNIIPDKAIMEGTVRTVSHSLRNEMPKLIKQIVESVTKAHGADYEFQYDKYYPPVINPENLTASIESAALDFLGKDNVVKLPIPTMIGEDFSFFQQHVPAVFFGIGTKNIQCHQNKM